MIMGGRWRAVSLVTFRELACGPGLILALPTELGMQKETKL